MLECACLQLPCTLLTFSTGMPRGSVHTLCFSACCPLAVELGCACMSKLSMCAVRGLVLHKINLQHNIYGIYVAG